MPDNHLLVDLAGCTELTAHNHLKLSANQQQDISKIQKELELLRRRIEEVESKLSPVSASSITTEHKAVAESQEVATASSFLDYNNELVIFHGSVATYKSESATQMETPSSRRSCKPTLPACLRLLLLKQAHNWHNIGILLHILPGDLKCIEADYRGTSKDCLREMLREWLKQSNPTWAQLVEAVKLFNPTTAEKILTSQQ